LSSDAPIGVSRILDQWGQISEIQATAVNTWYGNVTVGLQPYTLHEMIEINMKIEIYESRTPTLGTLSMISLKVDFVNIYYTILNNRAIISPTYIGVLQCLIMYIHVHDT